MRLVTFANAFEENRIGAEANGRIIDLCATDPVLPNSMRELLAGGEDALDAARKAAKHPHAAIASTAKLRAPMLDPQKVICIGLNYRDHAAESGTKLPSEPVI